MMASLTNSLPLLLGGAATAAAGVALVADVTHGGHPTHLMVLGTVVGVVAVLRRLGRRAVAAFPAVAAALAVQPALHWTSETRGPDAAHDHGNVLQHLLVSEVPTAGVQIAVPALGVVAATLAAHLLWLLIGGVRRPQPARFALCAPPQVLIPARVRRHGSMLRWCGWTIRAARRGPPLVFADAIC
jgi:hypothetical protein